MEGNLSKERSNKVIWQQPAGKIPHKKNTKTHTLSLSHAHIHMDQDLPSFIWSQKYRLKHRQNHIRTWHQPSLHNFISQTGMVPTAFLPTVKQWEYKSHQSPSAPLSPPLHIHTHYYSFFVSFFMSLSLFAIGRNPSKYCGFIFIQESVAEGIISVPCTYAWVCVYICMYTSINV